MINLKNLNAEQKRAVTFGSGPLLLISGAGTGKTTVITNRIVWLAETGKADIGEILALTFTEKAATEMQSRVGELADFGYLDPWISTFHSFCEKILRESGVDIGISSDFKVADETLSWLTFVKIKDALKLDYYKPLNNPGVMKDLFRHFSLCKEDGIYPENYTKRLPVFKNEKERVEEIIGAYSSYQSALSEKNLLDFGDLINYTTDLFIKRPIILRKYRKRFKYVLVDEFQDTNPSQYRLIKEITRPENNLMVCADDDQSIYGWRGASFANITRLKKDYRKLKYAILIRNYRSPQEILNKAHELSQLNNPHRLECISGINKKLRSTKKQRGTMEYLQFRNAEDEAQGVANKIIELLKKDKKLSSGDFAIMSRTNKDLNIFMSALEKANIPYFFFSKRGFYSKSATIDIVSYFNLLDDYHESPALFRVLSFPCFRIKPEDIIALSHFARKKSISLYEAIKRYENVPGLSSDGGLKFKNIVSLILKHTQISFREGVSEVFVRFLNDTKYLGYLAKKKQKEDLDCVNQFFARAKRFEEFNGKGKLPEFIRELEIESEESIRGKFEIETESSEDVVKVMTVHSAKGLEFNYVFLVGLADRKFPTIERKNGIDFSGQNREEDKNDARESHLREERRLFYVAMTRAKEKLFLTSAENYGGSSKRKPSVFLRELELIGKEIQSPSFNLNYSKKSKKGMEKIVVPNRFSYTQLAAFDNCPLQYKYAHIFKIPTKDNPILNFGKTIHDSLFDYQTKAINKKMTLGEFLRIYQSKWRSDWHGSEKEEEKLFSVGKRIIKNFHNDFSGNNHTIAFLNGKPALEAEINFKIGDYKFFGKIDRIDINDGGVELIDYKVNLSGKEKNKIGKREKNQLLTYWLAVESMGLIVTKLTIFYLGEKIEKVSIMPDKENIIDVKGEVLRQINNIQKSDFTANPGWNCKYCDFKRICESRAA